MATDEDRTSIEVVARGDPSVSISDTDPQAPPGQFKPPVLPAPAPAPDINSVLGTPPVSPLAPPDKDHPLTGLSKAFGTYKTERARIAKTEEDNLERDRRNAAYFARETALDTSRSFPSWETEKERQKYATDPLQAFGSLGSVFGILASAFTRQPLTTALNASASAMNAVREGNEAEYTRAFDAWKENTNLAVKRHGMMQHDYDNAIKLGEFDIRRAEQEIKNTVGKYQDTVVGRMIDQYGFSPEVIDMIQKRNDVAAKFNKVNEDITADSARRYMVKNFFDEIDKNEEITDPNVKAALKRNFLNLAMGINPDPKNPKDALLNMFLTTMAPGRPGGAKDMDTFWKKLEELGLTGRFMGGAHSAAAVDLAARYKDAAPVLEDYKALIGTEPSSVTKRMIEDAFTAKGREASERLGQLQRAMEEIRSRKEKGELITPSMADELLGKAMRVTAAAKPAEAAATSAARGLTKVDPRILEEAKHYKDVKPESFSGLTGPVGREVNASIESRDNIERIVRFVNEHKEALGLVGKAAAQVNVDKWKSIKDEKSATEVSEFIDNWLSKDKDKNLAARAKELSKMLTTQAFNDAATQGARGGTIYLDKIFREIYDQTSSQDAFLGVMRQRYIDADDRLKRLHMNITNRDDKTEYPFGSRIMPIEETKRGGKDGFIVH